ncbi:MAG: hypothetical protein IKD06_01590 [Clostridia bacterium]|nr:hypothetical protein [Clostridia bacterium]
MENKKVSPAFKALKGFIKAVYPTFTVEGAENLPDEPVVVVGNHAQLHGPLSCELYFPGLHYTWCVGEMLHVKEVPAYAYRDFWSAKPAYSRWFYKLLSYLIAPLSAFVFTNANTVSVYHDARALTTFKRTVQLLEEGANVILFPECPTPNNGIVHAFQDKFVDVAKLYYKKTGKELQFVPLYVCPALKKLCLGEPVPFRADAPIGEERARVCAELSERITQLARRLPAHRVVPYLNVPKKQYPTNLPTEGEQA